MISLQNISVTFKTDKNKAIHAVQHVSLEVDKGDVYGIVGYSGAGKSTLVRTINLLQRPTEGKVIVSGKDMMALNDKDLRESRKKIGMIFQHFNLMRSRTIYDNVAFPLKNSSLSKQEIHDKVTELLSLVGLSEKAKAYPSQLSGGQKQRVAIARALAMQPAIMLFDEPTSALDPELTGEVLRTIRQLAAEHMTMLVVTHEMAFAREVAHRVLFMDAGVIVEDRPAREFFASPRHPRACAFLQHML